MFADFQADGRWPWWWSEITLNCFLKFHVWSKQKEARAVSAIHWENLFGKLDSWPDFVGQTSIFIFSTHIWPSTSSTTNFYTPPLISQLPWPQFPCFCTVTKGRILEHVFHEADCQVWLSSKGWRKCNLFRVSVTIRPLFTKETVGWLMPIIDSCWQTG